MVQGHLIALQTPSSPSSHRAQKPCGRLIQTARPTTSPQENKKKHFSRGTCQEARCSLSGVHALLETTTDRRNVGTARDSNTHFSTRTRTDTPSKVGLSVAKSAKNGIAEPAHPDPHVTVAVQPEPRGCTTPPPANGRAKTLRTCPEAITTCEATPSGRSTNPVSMSPFFFWVIPNSRSTGRADPSLVCFNRSSTARGPNARKSTRPPRGRWTTSTPRTTLTRPSARLSFHFLVSFEGTGFLEAMWHGVRLTRDREGHCS